MTTDPLARSIVQRLENLIDGNAVTARQLLVESAARGDQSTTATVTLTYGWDTSIRILRGQDHPTSSHFCANRTVLEAETRTAWSQAVQSSTYNTSLGEMLRRASMKELLELPNRMNLTALGSWHYHDTCHACHGERLLNRGEQARHGVPVQQAAKSTMMDQELPLPAVPEGLFNTLQGVLGSAKWPIIKMNYCVRIAEALAK